MTIKETLATLESMGDEGRRRVNAKVGHDGTAPPDRQFGVSMADIRALAKQIKADKALALKLWQTGNFEAHLVRHAHPQAQGSFSERTRNADALDILCAGCRVDEFLSSSPSTRRRMRCEKSGQSPKNPGPHAQAGT